MKVVLYTNTHRRFTCTKRGWRHGSLGKLLTLHEFQSLENSSVTPVFQETETGRSQGLAD